MHLFGFGPHLTIDGQHASSDRLADPAHLGNALTAALRVVTPHADATATVYAVPGGLSGVITAGDAHIAVHAFPSHATFSADVFACHDYDAQAVLTALTDAFDAGRFEAHANHRGKEYPRDAQQLRALLDGERLYIQARLGLAP
ncbi:S-adenosylmethionine decarboxylase [Deinococcus maricopensis]|uniref:S-adenosylmethionine decarboxylase related protein n=1 Tax=Deinococcus maricopensis (strain DSM 21211 / LMG 22137 / NRRL B-23946 / LB-34) TaxID=709986 RepID=E8U7B5_DEIML|nr:S-adenosylmethionine decarboxylase [Deinococcus maricopensis]ADV66954.1 S-adenosylmethionine decarboxylase related protein [Deinococcus maricopensis DSM 21211]